MKNSQVIVKGAFDPKKLVDFISRRVGEECGGCQANAAGEERRGQGIRKERKMKWKWIRFTHQDMFMLLIGF